MLTKTELQEASAQARRAAHDKMREEERTEADKIIRKIPAMIEQAAHRGLTHRDIYTWETIKSEKMENGIYSTNNEIKSIILSHCIENYGDLHPEIVGMYSRETALTSTWVIRLSWN